MPYTGLIPTRTALGVPPLETAGPNLANALAVPISEITLRTAGENFVL
ncbi:hypothetical protein [Streptomyces sp. AC555_RSS877]|nr:hypothetical protein [Streptomyces sp. AC555_RSS877]